MRVNTGGVRGGVRGDVGSGKHTKNEFLSLHLEERCFQIFSSTYTYVFCKLEWFYGFRANRYEKMEI